MGVLIPREPSPADAAGAGSPAPSSRDPYRRGRPHPPSREDVCASAPGAAVDDGLVGRVEPERGVHRADGVVELLGTRHRRDADLGGRDHLDVDAGLGERPEELRGDAGVALMPAPTRAILPILSSRRRSA